MAFAFFCFALTGALGKIVLSTYPVAQMLFIRSGVALALLMPLIARQGVAGFRALERPWLQLLRVTISAVEVGIFFFAVAHIPLADTVAIYQSGPLFVTLWSALFLGEHVGWRRWMAVAVGFCGVIVALQPSAATVSLPAIVAVFGTMMYATVVILTRMLRRTPEMMLTGLQIGAAMILGLAAAFLPHGWVTPTWPDLGLLALIGIPSAIGFVCLNRAIKMAPASLVAPYQYTLIVWAAIFGYLIFGDVPAPTTVIGAIIIVGAGLYISWRERRLGKLQAPVVDPV